MQASWPPGRPLALLTVYRALVAAGASEAVDAVMEALQSQGFNLLAIHVRSLRDPFAVALLEHLIGHARPDVVVNATAFAASAPGRIGAVIVDHLTPSLTRTESYGPLNELEALVGEYHFAAGMDPRRLERLRTDILDLAASCGLKRPALKSRDIR